jgi:pyruvate dehydrogenase E2 component (dihydrolipoamide acetyltransferase)
MADFTMPSLGADMDEGTLLEWLVKPGDSVHKGDIVAVVDTAKAAVEVESFVEGVVGRLLVEPGTVVPVGTALATLESTDGAAAPRPERAQPHEPVATSTPPAAERHEAAPPEVHSPLVRRLAKQLGVDLSQVTGTGRDGRITRTDVTQAAEAARKLQPAGRRTPGRVTPYAQRLAAELGVDLASLAPSDGQPIRAADVRAAAAGAPAVASEPVVAEPAGGAPQRPAVPTGAP